MKSPNCPSVKEIERVAANSTDQLEADSIRPLEKMILEQNGLQTHSSDLMFDNIMEMSDALMKAGGNPAIVLADHRDLFITLARNGVKISAKHINVKA